MPLATWNLRGLDNVQDEGNDLIGFPALRPPPCPLVARHGTVTPKAYIREPLTCVVR